MKSIIKEPLIHFLLLGGLIFVLYGFLNRNVENPESNEIIIQDSDIDRLAKAYHQNWNTLPDSATLKQLIASEIEAEMLYREALRLNLDHNDEIIRRRLKQKYEFLVKDLVVSEIPTDSDLKKYYEKNSANYESSKLLSFTQIYFSPDSRSNPLQDAKAFLETVKDKPFEALDLSNKGDAFHLQQFFGQRDFAAVRQSMGKDFANALFSTQQTGWLEPITSGYGIHAVHVSKVDKGQAVDFERVKAQVLQDWQQEQFAIYNKNLLDNLAKQYEVVYDLNEYEGLVQ